MSLDPELAAALQGLHEEIAALREELRTARAADLLSRGPQAGELITEKVGDIVKTFLVIERVGTSVKAVRDGQRYHFDLDMLYTPRPGSHCKYTWGPPGANGT